MLPHNPTHARASVICRVKADTVERIHHLSPAPPHVLHSPPSVQSPPHSPPSISYQTTPTITTWKSMESIEETSSPMSSSSSPIATGAGVVPPAIIPHPVVPPPSAIPLPPDIAENAFEIDNSGFTLSLLDPMQTLTPLINVNTDSSNNSQQTFSDHGWKNSSPTFESRKREKCNICQTESNTQKHYGGTSCIPCKAFFRRAVTTMKDYKLQKCRCVEVRNNTYKSSRLKQCPFCRYQKCLENDMKPELVLSGGQNALKHTNRGLNALQKDSSSISARTTNSSVVKSETPEIHKLGNLNPMKETAKKMSVLAQQFRQARRTATARFLSDIQGLKQSSKQETFDSFMRYCLNIVILFLKQNAEMKTVPESTRRALICKSSLSVILMIFSTMFDGAKFRWEMNEEDLRALDIRFISSITLSIDKDTALEYSEEAAVVLFFEICKKLHAEELSFDFKVLMICLLVFNIFQPDQKPENGGEAYITLLDSYLAEPSNSHSVKSRKQAYSLLWSVRECSDALNVLIENGEINRLI